MPPPVPTNRPPSAEHWFGTTSTGQDVFWMLTFGMRNTLMIAGLVVSSSLLVSQGKAHELWVLGFLRLETLGVFGYLIAAVMGLWLLISIIRSRHV